MTRALALRSVTAAFVALHCAAAAARLQHMPMLGYKLVSPVGSAATTARGL
jgi:hypothetical protein